MTKLSVNLNKVALLRNTRSMRIPRAIDAARTCVIAGTHGVTVHPRPEQKHIKPSDVYELADMLSVEFNIEGNPFVSPFMKMVQRAKPNQCTPVPDAPDAFTSDHGWDLHKEGKRLVSIVEELRNLGIRVSSVVNLDVDRIQLAGADALKMGLSNTVKEYLKILSQA